ncbi:MAG TPA: hypothetical protein VLH40_09460 [Atribacteraceae bacterium]|nr:hypothetical protein [Atribacteraceae bacterium]
MSPEKKPPARRPRKPESGIGNRQGNKRSSHTPGKDRKLQDQSAKPRARIAIGDYFLPFLLFGITIMVFLNFTGIIEIPFLDFLRTATPEAVPAPQNSLSTDLPPEEPVAEPLFPGPDLEQIRGVKDEEASVDSTAATEITSNPPLVVEATPLIGQDPEVIGEPVTEAREELIAGPEDERGLMEENEEPAIDPEGIWRLSRIYAAMEPAEAARILENIGQQEVVAILSTMKEREVARILSAMDVEQATEISKAMIGRR